MLDIEELRLTTSRSARKSLGLDASVDLADIRECNQQSWRWLVIADRALRAIIAGLYRYAYLRRVCGPMLAQLLGADTPAPRLMPSTEWLVENTAKVPSALPVACRR